MEKPTLLTDEITKDLRLDIARAHFDLVTEFWLFAVNTLRWRAQAISDNQHSLYEAVHKRSDKYFGIKD